VIDMLYLCIEKIFGLTNGCRILEIIFCRLATMILVRSIEEVGDRLNEREELTFVTVAEYLDILLRNSLVEDLVVFVAKLWTMRYSIAL
jgi:hypothetical protein